MIYGHQLRKLSLETLQTYLMGQVISFALLKVGIESLHATAVAFGNEAVGFLGDCGTGKSTLAAACVRAGFPLLTDDLLRLDNHSGRLLAYPGPARIKLMPKTAKQLLGPAIKSAPVNPLTSKQIIPLKDNQSIQRLMPLRVLYLLKPPRGKQSNNISIRTLSKRKAWQALAANTFNICVYEPKRYQTHFLWASQLAQQITVKALTYPRQLSLLPKVIETIREDIQISTSLAR